MLTRAIRAAAVAAVLAVAATLVVFAWTRTDQRPPGTSPQSTWISTGSLKDTDQRYLFRTENIVDAFVRQGRVSLTIRRGEIRTSVLVSASEDDVCRVLRCTVLTDSVEPN